MKHKFFSIKELKQSLEDNPDCENNPIVNISLEMLKSIIATKKPVPKKGPAFFSYKGLNMN
ncbi:hypothetical protein [Chryseobacterium vrystaatense]|uniref:Uncharacterized protein n=1 Tax=Chryseobacterium vrystaatense TaxID=307480 RepID=A0ABR4UJE0_9FLAO|nr:hypothetical protein [Chryseobacterium vrystaatense]KFF24768.1 hypothetical protein IW16_17690 [Chryseobacterium vrystaatense]